MEPVPTALLSARDPVLAERLSGPLLVALRGFGIGWTLIHALLGLHSEAAQTLTHHGLDRRLPVWLQLRLGLGLPLRLERV